MQITVGLSFRLCIDCDETISITLLFLLGTGGADTGYSLKERQVARLRMEMQHPAGVRIILKKRDCLNTIALIDALGTVW